MKPLSRTIEPEFANYTLVERNIFRVTNKERLIPSIVRKTWAIRADERATYINMDAGKTLFAFDVRQMKC